MLFVYNFVVVVIDPRSVQGHGHWLRSSCGHKLNGVRFTHRDIYNNCLKDSADFVKHTPLLHHPGLFACRHVLFVYNKTKCCTCMDRRVPNV